MKTSSQLHFGVEEEFALLYADGALANEADAVLARVPDRYKPDRVKRDLHFCIVEVTTPVCDSPAEVERSLAELRGVVAEAAAALDLRVISSGVHPTAPMEQGELVETPRFRRLIEGGALRGDGVHFGFHLHVSLDGPETRVGVVNRLRWADTTAPTLADVPSEARLEPELWGWVRFMGRPKGPGHFFRAMVLKS